jgi:hypothetical protein
MSGKSDTPMTDDELDRLAYEVIDKVRLTLNEYPSKVRFVALLSTLLIAVTCDPDHAERRARIIMDIDWISVARKWRNPIVREQQTYQ